MPWSGGPSRRPLPSSFSPQRPCLHHYVHVLMLQRNRLDEVAATYQDSGGLGALYCLAAGEGDEVRPRGDKTPQVFCGRQVHPLRRR